MLLPIQKLKEECLSKVFSHNYDRFPAIFIQMMQLKLCDHDFAKINVLFGVLQIQR